MLFSVVPLPTAFVQLGAKSFHYLLIVGVGNPVLVEILIKGANLFHYGILCEQNPRGTLHLGASRLPPWSWVIFVLGVQALLFSSALPPWSRSDK